MTADRAFVDTNVLIYAHDRSAGQKREAARTLLADLWASRAGVLSTQVLQEFYLNVTRKLPQPLPPARARDVVGRYSAWPVHRIEPVDILRASELADREPISFWDALIVVAASRLGATRLVTEDLQPGRSIAGVRIESPFASGPGSDSG
jgi:predicted nucleic acid-binding protein